MIQKILLQITNLMMAAIVLYVSDTFFIHIEMSMACVIFSSIVLIGCLLSLLFFIAFVSSKVQIIDKFIPYDSFLIFVAMIGALVTAVPFLL